MATKSDRQKWVEEALRANKGSAYIVDVARSIWSEHEADLKVSGDLFFTWQYDMRWAANQLRRNEIMVSVDDSPRGVWQLK